MMRRGLEQQIAVMQHAGMCNSRVLRLMPKPRRDGIKSRFCRNDMWGVTMRAVLPMRRVLSVCAALPMRVRTALSASTLQPAWACFARWALPINAALP